METDLGSLILLDKHFNGGMFLRAPAKKDLMPHPLMVRARTLNPSIEVRVLVGHPISI
jgi:hypothetical protein